MGTGGMGTGMGTGCYHVHPAHDTGGAGCQEPRVFSNTGNGKDASTNL